MKPHVFAACDVFLYVSESSEPQGVVEKVRCLECGTVYAKPNSPNTVANNPGCPECGYVGWLAASVPISEELEQRRFGAGRLRLHRV
jgi:NAD-dependent SIR2 family protein deacetylase